jgi:hypothetical protein
MHVTRRPNESEKRFSDFLVDHHLQRTGWQNVMLLPYPLAIPLIILNIINVVSAKVLALVLSLLPCSFLLGLLCNCPKSQTSSDDSASYRGEGASQSKYDEFENKLSSVLPSNVFAVQQSLLMLAYSHARPASLFDNDLLRKTFARVRLSF